MKRMLALMIAGTMVLSMTACGQSGQADAAPAAETQTEVTTEAETKTEEVAEAAVADDAQTEATTEEGTADDAAATLGTAGGWTKADSPAITDEIRELIEKATEGMTGAAYEPVAYIGSQIVAGTNYAILCTITPVVPDAVGKYAVVIIYKDLDGNVTITEVRDSDAEAEVAPGGGAMLGGWALPETPDVTEEAAAALAKAAESKLGADYTPIALLATQLVSGTNYSILCEVTAVTPDGAPAYAIVRVYQDLDGNAEITDIYEVGAAE